MAPAVAIGCRAPEPERAGLRVVATLPPLAGLAEELGGDRVVVQALLGPRSDPEVGALPLSALRALAGADLVVALGGGVLPFEQQLLRATEGEGALPVVLVQGGVEPTAGELESGSLTARGSSDGADPHAWLDPTRMVATARRLADRLAELDPDGASGHRQRLAQLEARLDAVDRRIRAELARAGGGVLLSEHPTWEVLARRYGARVLAIEQEEREASARRLVDVIEEARGARARAIAVAPGSRRRLANAVARELGIAVVEIEPLAYDWLESLERAALLAAGASDSSPPRQARALHAAKPRVQGALEQESEQEPPEQRAAALESPAPRRGARAQPELEPPHPRPTDG